ncbi:hypothetical protein [Mesorhizobium sp. 131-2-1]|uniref:hypothetical protein n=1 Tax=Mesorhizobium sp. 131-2-1 TaxID=2744518 RepID=UPI00192641B8|nr:hypothetical protein [Mesorhizobium sp. 131-2-1]BCG97994.1 hypothetical protein MesoLj131a_68580 [Mesorhizobium sp. 131-2-1]
MGFFSDLNKRLTDNIYAHGHYLTDPHADDPVKLEETVELLMPFVRSESRELVRRRILELISQNKHEDLDL